MAHRGLYAGASEGVSLGRSMSEVPARIGPYAIVSRLGVGGMAETFVATRDMQGVEQRVCVKRILPAYAKDPTARRLFVREANISARLRHANLVTILDVGEDQGAPYLVMELVEGSDLGGILERAPDQKLPADLVAYVLVEMAHGLHEAHGGGGAHAGVVHRDLSPSNVLVSTMGEVKVADFGIAKALSGDKATATVTRGKFAYMAPEQLDGGELDPRADFFALGVMGYEMVAGVRPFDADHDARLVLLIAKNERRHVSEVAPDAPTDLQDTIEALLSPKREDRPADGHAIVERLAPVVPPSMVARRKLGALAQVALTERLSGEPKDPTAPDESWPALAATVLAVETEARASREARGDASEPDVHAAETKRRPVAVEPIGTNPSFADTLRTPATRSRVTIAMVAVALLAIGGGATWALSGSSPAAIAPTTPTAQPEAPAAAPPAAVQAEPQPAPEPPPPTPATTPPTVEPPPVGSGPGAHGHDTHHDAPVAPAEPTPSTPAPTEPGPTEPAPAEPAPADSPSTEDRVVGRGRIHVVASPWGDVWIDHRFYGRAPVDVALPPGSHAVEAGFTEPQSRRNVRLREGQDLRITFDLTDVEAP